MTESTAQRHSRLHMRGVCKRYGATRALEGVDLVVEAGEVHALLGENGAGKSTLMRILAGAVRPDAGTIHIDGRGFSPGDPHAARRAGIGMIHQELCLASHLSVEANIALGMEEHTGGVIRSASMRARARDALARLGRDDIDPRTIVRRLSPAERQMVEIARALAIDARIIVMDEPTSSLGLHDIERLFDVISALKSQGVSVIYISHFLNEVARIADRWTVLRDGRVVAAGGMRDASTERLVELMIGRRLSDMHPRMPHAARHTSPPALSAREVCGSRLPQCATLVVQPGEIVGVAGLVGAGRTEMLRCLFGLDVMTRGEVRVHGRVMRRASPVVSFARGMGMLSEDRATEGLASGMSIADNITLGGLQRLARWGWVRSGKQRAAANTWAKALSTRMRAPDQPIGELSGGNQQKIALARLLYREANMLLLDEPTRGIDVGSRALIQQVIRELAAAGKAVIIVSSAMNELLAVCDRIVVMHRGRMVADRSASDWSEHTLLRAAVGGSEHAHAS